MLRAPTAAWMGCRTAPFARGRPTAAPVCAWGRRARPPVDAPSAARATQSAFFRTPAWRYRGRGASVPKEAARRPARPVRAGRTIVALASALRCRMAARSARRSVRPCRAALRAWPALRFPMGWAARSRFARREQDWALVKFAPLEPSVPAGSASAFRDSKASAAPCATRSLAPAGTPVPRWTMVQVDRCRSAVRRAPPAAALETPARAPPAAPTACVFTTRGAARPFVQCPARAPPSARRSRDWLACPFSRASRSAVRPRSTRRWDPRA